MLLYHWFVTTNILHLGMVNKSSIKYDNAYVLLIYNILVYSCFTNDGLAIINEPTNQKQIICNSVYQCLT